jgi:starvation-inducible outer membrane lipoprotein
MVMIKKFSTIAILVFSFNQKTYAESQTANEVNDQSKQEVSWPGYVSQSFMSQGLLCYELVKTETFKNHKPIPKSFINDSNYISCSDSKKDLTKSNNRYVTVTGKIIGTLESDDYQYPVVMADKIRKWKYSSLNDENVGKIKPRFSRSRLEQLLNGKGI